MQNLKIEFLDEDYSAYTLAPVIAKFMEEFLGLESLFKSNLTIKKRFSQFPIEKLSFISVFLIILGLERFSHLNDK